MTISHTIPAQALHADYSLFEKREYVKGKYTLPYRILWPENMDNRRQYPLFIYLHGMGQGGTDNEKQLHHRADLFLEPENRAKYPCIVLFPQVPFGRGFIHLIKNGRPTLLSWLRKFSDREENCDEMGMILSPYGVMLYELIEKLISSKLVDTNRIYLSGSSMGAFSVFEFITEYPDMFAAAAPMSGGAVLATMGKWVGKVPVWIMHGDADPIIPVTSSHVVVAELKRRGVTNFRYSEFKGVKHHSWEKAFAEPDFLEWFFSKRKK
jgi:predicted peptidase